MPTPLSDAAHPTDIRRGHVFGRPSDVPARAALRRPGTFMRVGARHPASSNLPARSSLSRTASTRTEASASLTLRNDGAKLRRPNLDAKCRPAYFAPRVIPPTSAASVTTNTTIIPMHPPLPAS